MRYQFNITEQSLKLIGSFLQYYYDSFPVCLLSTWKKMERGFTLSGVDEGSSNAFIVIPNLNAACIWLFETLHFPCFMKRLFDE